MGRAKTPAPPQAALAWNSLLGRMPVRVTCRSPTLWLNLGDTYASDKERAKAAGVKPGDLIGLPWRVALPRGIEVMERDESLLDVRAGAHLLRAAYEDPHLNARRSSGMAAMRNLL